jgi:hypothetical protein
MTKLSALTLPVAISLALVSGASVAQDRPNTTLVQKSKASATASKANKSTSAAPAQRGVAGEPVDAKRTTPTGTRTAPSTEAMPHDCQGNADA